MTQQNLSSRNNSFRVYLGSCLLFLYTFSSILVFGIPIILCIVLPFSVRYKIATLWVSSIMWVAKVSCGLTYRVEGLENLPTDQTYVVLCKHQSAWETLAVRLFLPMQTSVLKRSLTWIPIGGWALATLKPIAIDRENQREALKTLVTQGTARLEEGFIVIIFPEGTRAAPGENLKFNAGGALLAQKANRPVIPLAHNAGEFWPRYSFLKYSGTITVKLGPAISTTGKKAKQINSEAEAWIAQTMDNISTPSSQYNN